MLSPEEEERIFPSATARSLLPGNFNFGLADGDGDIELLRSSDVLDVLLVRVLTLQLLNPVCILLAGVSHVVCCDDMTEILQV